ncbi:MAG: hypothetical protein V4819_06895 [Verrucomicrobiota bacterium]
MPDLKARLIDAAVRPLASDAEVIQSGKGFLATLTTTPARGAEDALKRWDALGRAGCESGENRLAAVLLSGRDGGARRLADF